MNRGSIQSWLPIALILVVIGNLTVLAEFRLRDRDREVQKDLVFDAVGTIRARLEVLLGQQLYITRAVASHIGSSPQISQQEFSKYVANFLPVDSVVSVVAAAAEPELAITRIYPVQGNESVLGYSYRTSIDQREPALKAIEENSIVLAGPLNLVQGGVGFVARVPAFVVDEESANRTLWGLIAAVIPAETLYREVGLTSEDLNINVALRGVDASGPDGAVFFGDDTLFDLQTDAVTVPINLGSGSWLLAAIPKGGWGVGASSEVWLVRGLGFTLALFTCLAAFFRFRYSRRQEAAEKNFRDLFEANNEAMFIHDADSLTFMDVNHGTTTRFGYDKSELVGKHWSVICSSGCLVDLNSTRGILENDGKIVFETEHKRKDGSLVPVEISAKQIDRPEGPVIISTARDITDRKLAEDALRKSQQDLVNAIESINEGFTLWGKDGCLRLFNQRYIELSPHLKDIIRIGVSFREVLEYVYDQGLVTIDVNRDEWIEMRLRDHSEPTGPYEFRVTDGRYIKISEYLTPDGSCVGIYEDITELKRATEHIHYRAYFDVLTGLPNRENFLGKLGETLSVVKRTQQICALMFIDLDRFKSINDTLGHAVGDKLLREVALRLRSVVRETDFVARFAGDEFVVLLRYIDAPINGLRIAQNLLTKLGAVYELDEREVYCSASIGIALAPNDTVEAETYLRYADLAMYQAKSGGGNAYRFFTNNMTESAHRFVTIEKDLWQSIKEEQCLLNYQPVFDLQNNELTSVEALVRWQHPEFGLLLPDEFIPVAEETAFIDELGRWVISEAAQTTVNWANREQGKPLSVAVNVSSRQFWGQFDVQFVRDTIAAAGFPTQRLIVEITESLVLGEEQRIVKVLEELRELGVGISIDDFGTGYSAISYLKRLPVTALKIDKSFIRDIERSLDDALLVESVIAMAKALRVKVCAEGIETQNQLRMLQEMGCDFGQGMWFGEPLSADDFRHRFLASNVVPLRDGRND